jgi:anti-anti-sigma factor
MNLDLHATPQEVMRAVEALQDFARARCVPEKTIFDLALALEECGSNIVNHGLKRDSTKTFQVKIEMVGGTFSIELCDTGPAFDPTAVPQDKPQTGDDDLPGGWGIQLVRRHTDSIHYAREGQKNVLRLTKMVSPGLRENKICAGESVGGESYKAEQPTSAMPLEIHIQKSVSAQGGASTVKLTGSLDTATAPDLEHQLAPVLSAGAKDIVFDLAELKFISSAGLRVFSSTRKTLKERGGQASFVHMQPQIQEVFEIIKSLPGVAIFRDLAEFDRYLAVRQKSYEENQSSR